MLFWKYVIVGDRERALVIRNGRFQAILDPGTYWLFKGFQSLEVTTYNALENAFLGDWADYFLKQRPDIIERYFTEVSTRDTEVALVSVDGRARTLSGPGKRVLFWQSARISTEVFDGARELEVPAGTLKVLDRLGLASFVVIASVPEGNTGLLFVDSRYVRDLAPGKYGFWTTAGTPRVETIDVRRQTLEVPGQEILTQDKVSIRVNIASAVQVTDPLAAKTAVSDWKMAVYQAVQIAVRQSLGKRTLEQVLAEKTDVDEAVLRSVSSSLKPYGVNVESIAIKDIVLPGDVREILNRVVVAEKEAQANLIRRREETAATRSLLNTAKLMEDNPVLVRLKELETLEKLTAKVGKITVTGGFNGLIENLLKQDK